MRNEFRALMAIGVMMGASSAPVTVSVGGTSRVRLRHVGNNKPAFDREKQNRRNRIAKLSRRRNRGR